MKLKLFFLLYFLFIFYLNAQIPKLWGTTNYGGTSNDGVLYKINGNGTGYTTLYTFSALTNGIWPNQALLQVNQSKLYCMAATGGNPGSGVIFYYDTISNGYVKAHDFNDTAGAQPYGNLMQANNGKLYGMTRVGGAPNGNGFGTIFSFDPNNNTCVDLHDFSTSDGQQPWGTLVQAGNGKLYGVTTARAQNNNGSIFSFDPSNNSFFKLYDLSCATGCGTGFSKLLMATNGILYGMASGGGANNLGVIYSFDPSNNTYTKLYDFTTLTGRFPGNLMQASNGLLYGLTQFGGANNYGVLFSYNNSNNSFTKLYDFVATTGRNPYGSLMQASDGKLYGTTDSGGVNNKGVIFNFAISSSTYTKIFDFNGANGANPLGELIELKASANDVIEFGSNNFSLYPNPANEKITVSLGDLKSQEMEISLVNVLGRTVLKQKLMDNRQSFDISEIENGLYFIIMTDGKSKTLIVNKVIIQH